MRDRFRWCARLEPSTYRYSDTQSKEINMTDFWEVLGRLVTNGDFRTTLFGAFSPGSYPIDLTHLTASIPKAQYGSAADIIAKKTFADRPVSVMAIGELLYSMSYQRFRDFVEQLSQAITASRVPTSNRTPLFYMGLGDLIVDAQTAQFFHAGQFDQAHYTALTNPERGDLQTLADPAGSLAKISSSLCAFLWTVKCFVKQFAYDGHTHPIANIPPTIDMPRFLL
jgi:hypothetical protein